MTTPTGRAKVPGTPATSGRASVGRATVGLAQPGDSGPGGRGPGGPGARPPVPGGTPYRGKGRRPRWGRIALVGVLALTLIGLLGGFGAYLYANHLDSQISRTDPFSQITGGRPAKVSPGAMNILMLGSDSRNPDATAANADKSRSDTIILMHVQADHKHAYLISIPRDLYVPIPGHDRDKINAAFAYGGLPLVIRTIEGFTDVHIDHLALIDFAGFQAVTDALGGVDMNVDQTITSIHKPFRKFTKGMNHFNGAEALDYIRQRYQFPDGDITRAKHQQQFLRAIMDKAASSGTLANPAKLASFLDAVTKAMTVDKDFSLKDMALEFHNLRGNDLTFLTSPFSGFDVINGQSVVLSDRKKASALYEAVVKDNVAGYLAAASAAPSAGTGG
ncbi:MAG: transcriptional regulator [Actinobacteria bacterium 13_2_20CM_2_71_6]|nr:MAG: transcriptional regulator [Actinobacteria bacterium 13_2_20CM_2_71_6]